MYFFFSCVISEEKRKRVFKGKRHFIVCLKLQKGDGESWASDLPLLSHCGWKQTESPWNGYLKEAVEETLSLGHNYKSEGSMKASLVLKTMECVTATIVSLHYPRWKVKIIAIEKNTDFCRNWGDSHICLVSLIDDNNTTYLIVSC